MQKCAYLAKQVKSFNCVLTQSSLHTTRQIEGKQMLPLLLIPQNSGGVQPSVILQLRDFGWLRRRKSTNFLEMLAVLFAFKSFTSLIHSKHVKVIVDNTTTESTINKMGTSRSPKLNKLMKDMRGIGALSTIYGYLWLVYQDVRMLRQTNSHAHFQGVPNGP